MNKTFTLKPADINRTWVIVDAAEVPLGRLSSVVASRLIGKYKPTYTPHVDDGDYVIVINADNLVVTGDKESAKTYYRHSGFPGGLKERSLKEQRVLGSSKIIEKAVKGMLPKNKLATDRLARLRVFGGAEHTHNAQKPVKLEVK
ncbi:50S ribosomal protein L13 [Candidatus Saccharibacteria bacterium]|nr:50S ribosomal protein L13 [Candidatus Saccharibacteria bacterium]NCU40611.1 50S ribosomal protein L13 [Candidatus Saccharibacteria bacterium]